MDVKFSDIFKRPLTHEELSQLNKTDLVELVAVYQNRESLLTQALAGVVDLAEKLAETSLAISKRLFKMLDVFFSGSLKSKSTRKIRDKKPKKLPVRGKLLPSKRYPNVPVTDYEVTMVPHPQCGCGYGMSDSGMRESSERLEVQPKQYHIIRHNRVTYTCGHCHQGIATAPPVPQIIPGSCYGDSFVKDVVLSKLCDLIPISRYVAMAARQGVEDIPANSLHEFARHLAIYLGPSYLRLTDDIKRQLILFADETRHRMLEGSKKKTWYLWSFNSGKGVVYRLEDTRASVVAERFLLDCDCKYLVSDAYQGYYRALLVINKMRTDKYSDAEIILPVFCNAHARNMFCASSIKNTRPAKYARWIYKIIFASYHDYVTLEGEEFEKVKSRMTRGFQMLDRIANRQLSILSKNSALHEAFAYFYKYSTGLTLFLTDKSIPMHNNQSERSLRNHVIGRKTWYGTHSPDIARDLVKVMSLVESCKMLKVNPRRYVDDAVERVHRGFPALSPYEYGQLIGNSS